MERTTGQVLDELLVLRSQEGDADAFSALVRRYQPRLLRHALHLTGQADDAEDVVQEAWMAVTRGLAGLDDPACFRRWLYQIVTRRCVDWVRLRQRQRHLTVQATSELPEQLSPVPDDDVGRLRHAMRRLPGDLRVLLAMHYLDGMAIAEIAQALTIPEGTVKSRLFQARQELKEVLERSRT